MDRTISNLLLVFTVVFTLALTGYRARVQRDIVEKVRVVQYNPKPQVQIFEMESSKTQTSK
jgi:hypothetical protein